MISNKEHRGSWTFFGHEKYKCKIWTQNKLEKPDKPNKPNDNTSTGGTNDNNGNANGNTNNTGGSQNQSGILFPIDGEVSELESELIGMIKTTGKEKNYELVEYVNDVNREHTEVLMELNINGIMDTAYSYGDQRLTNERFTEWTGYYTYDPRGSVTGVTDSEGMIWQSYRYDAFGSLTFGQPQYNNVYTYNAESYNPNVDAQYLRARYYSPTTADFISEDSYLGKLTDPLSLNRYNYVKSSPLNYVDPSGHVADYLTGGSNQSSNTVPYAAFEQQRNSLFEDLQSKLESGSANMKLGGSNLKISIKKAEDAQETDFCEDLKAVGSFLLGMMVGDSAYTKNLGVSLVDWITGGKVSQAMNALTGYLEGEYVDRYLDGEMYYEGKALVDLMYYWQTLPAAELVDYLSELGEGAGETIGISLGTGLVLDKLSGVSGGGTLITTTGKIVAGSTTATAGIAVSIVIGGVIITLIEAETNGVSQDRYNENKDKADSYKEDGETATTNKGNEVDISPNKNHTTTTKNPGATGSKNSSVDIVDENGNVKTRRWFDEQGHAHRDVDMTNHGNPSTHPEWPHEHIWDWSSGNGVRK